MKTYTAFCNNLDGTGTTWIGTVQAADLFEANEKAQDQCAADWGCKPEDVWVRGLAAGDVEILQWEDLDK